MTTRLPGWVVVLALFCGLAWAGFLARGHITGFASVLDRFETVLLDLRIVVTGERSPPADVIVVAIDDPTVAETGTYPLTRDRLATLIAIIRDAGAKALAIDILLAGASSPDGDTQLAESLNGFPTVLVAAGQVREAAAPASGVPALAPSLSPLPLFADASDVGLANIVTDAGGTPRHIPLLFLTEDGLQPSFGLRSVGLYLEEAPGITGSGVRLGDRTQSLDLGWHLALNYYGAGGAIPTISAKALFDGTQLAMAQLKGRLVVLGVTATAVGDRFNSPFDPIMPGVEIQATGMANLIDGSHLTRDATTRWADGAAAMGITLVGMIAVVFLPLAPASVFYLVLLIGWLGVLTVLFVQGYWLSGALPFAASLPPVVGLIIIRQVTDRYHARRHFRAQEALSRFQSPVLAERIAQDPSFLLEPREQTIAVLFVDLSGYTGLSEELGAAKTRDFLKGFHTVVVDVANANGGVVLDFMGDGAMLGFGIPDPGKNDAVNAVRCAFLLENAVTDWLRAGDTRSETGTVRVGAHVGRVILSRLGHENQQQITTTGDSVNVASRLLEVGKEKRATVVLSTDLIRAAETEGRLDATVPRLETVAIRGRQKGLDVGLWKAEETAVGLQPFQ